MYNSGDIALGSYLHVQISLNDFCIQYCVVFDLYP